jgi:hypothetical protein
MNLVKIGLAGALFGAAFALTIATLAAHLRTEDMYQACFDRGWYPVEGIDSNGEGGRAILCTVVTSEQLKQALEN